MTDVSLKCACGKVRGIARNVSPSMGTRLVCCCNDCQVFARYLKQEDAVLDEYVGTDIFQMPMAYVVLTEGSEHIRCLKLTEKGMHRWYTDCCKTPIGNTLTAGVPFVGMIHSFMDDDGRRESNLGPVRGYWVPKSSITPAQSKRASRFMIFLILRTFGKMIIWKLKGLNKPSPFFDNTGKPITVPIILNRKTA